MVYAHVDVVNTQSTYGGVLEVHEILGGPYNNIPAPVVVTTPGQRLSVPVVTAASGQGRVSETLPLRPAPERRSGN